MDYIWLRLWIGFAMGSLSTLLLAHKGFEVMDYIWLRIWLVLEMEYSLELFLAHEVFDVMDYIWLWRCFGFAMGSLSTFSFAQVLGSLLVPSCIATSTKRSLIVLANRWFLSALIGSGILEDLYWHGTAAEKTYRFILETRVIVWLVLAKNQLWNSLTSMCMYEKLYHRTGYHFFWVGPGD